MQPRHHIHRTVLHVGLAMFLASLVALTVSSTQAALTLGHQVLLEKGLQIKALLGNPSSGVALYKACNFTSIDLGQWSSTHNYQTWAAAGLLPTGANTLNFSHWFRSGDDANNTVCSSTYLPYLVSIQLADEQSIVNTPAYPNQLTTMAADVATIKANHPNAMVYTNQTVYNDSLTLSTLNTYIQTVKPDMLCFTEYPFRFQGTYFKNYDGGSPKYMYQHIEMYRKAGLAGTGAKPIPVGMYAQTFSDPRWNQRQPTESEFRLQQFAGWAAGMKSIDAYQYPEFNATDTAAGWDAMFLDAAGAPTTQYYQYKELNRQSAHLGPALVRLISTDFRMKMGSHGTTPVTNTLPSGVTAFSTTADPYLTSITAANQGSRNNGLAGDVLYGAFKPLDPSLVAAGSENDKYFMIVNGLSDGAGNAAACRQVIHLTFDFGASGITSLLRLSRETGLVEEVGLTRISGSQYSLDLTLDGGTGDLFKYNTGTAFVPEPSAIVLLIPSMFGLLAYAWRKRH